MATEQPVLELLARADAERAAGRGAEAARVYDESAVLARQIGDHDSWVRAALGAASVQVFGAEPGRLPSLLYDVLARSTDDAQRSRLAAALARCWVYASEADRATAFGEEAVTRARAVGDPALVADALDAALTAHWGPDDLEVRRDLAAEMAEVAAHVSDPDVRLQAHLWGLHAASEALDVQAMHRQMRALELLGEESPRAAFFAATRRVMLDVLRGRTDTTERLLAAAGLAAEQAFIPDAWMVIAAIRSFAGIQVGATGELKESAALAEEFALREGAREVCAEAAYCWVGLGEIERARGLLRTFHGGVLAGLPRDVNWLLTLQCVLESALAAGDRELVEEAAALLTPYRGRAVMNAGAVWFHGTTDDTLSRAYALIGRDAEAAECRERALRTYERIGAQWWHDRLLAGPSPGSAAMPHLHPTDAGLWSVGPEATPVPELRGFGYLRVLLGRPWQEVGALELAGGGGPVLAESGHGELADRQALAAYRQRLADLDTEIAEAEDWADAGRLAAARSEREALLEELSRVAGLGGRARTSGSSQERARVAVKKAITSAIERIAAVDEPTADHLRASIRTGLRCAYEPAPDTARAWVLG